MDNRKYNIYFHTHTISGIIICALLYVIFFAGSFSFFKDDIAAWQKNTSHIEHRASTSKDFNHIFDSLAQHRKLKGRDFDFTIARHGMSAYVSMSASHDSTIKKKAEEKGSEAGLEDTGRGGRDKNSATKSSSRDTSPRRNLEKTRMDSAPRRVAGKGDVDSSHASTSLSQDTGPKKKVAKKEPEAQNAGRGRGRSGDSAYFTYDFTQKKEADYKAGYDMGEFLYRLHFLAQLNVIPIRLGAPFGYLLAGVVSFIFLFALITGLLLHWDKIASNFFTFRPWSKWKTVWTDLHTALGVIGFPFQLIFAITGIVLIVNSFLLGPYTKFLYQGDSKKIYQALEYSDSTKFEYTYKPLTTPFDMNAFVANTEKKWDGGAVSLVSIKNYQDSNMHVIIQSKPKADRSFAGSGKIIYRVSDGEVLYETSPVEHSTYIDKVKALVYHLHFGDFGGRPLRVMFFVLGVMGCVIIISGILIWLVARDKNKVPKHKRVFNFWTANIFLAVCLSMLPVTAFTMIVLLFIDNPGQSDIYHWYFYSWLVLGLYFVARRNIALTNHQTLFLSALTCLLLPVFHGIRRNNWIWNTFNRGAYDLLFIDLLFLFLGIICVSVLYKMKYQNSLKKDI